MWLRKESMRAGIAVSESADEEESESSSLMPGRALSSRECEKEREMFCA